MSKYKNLLTQYRTNREELDRLLAKKTNGMKLLGIALCCLAIAFAASLLARLFGGEVLSPTDFSIPMLFILCVFNARLAGLYRLEIIHDILDDESATNK